MHGVRITVEEISKTQMMIKKFNLQGEHAIGMIRVELIMGDTSTFSIFHVIDTKTSYKLLLGRHDFTNMELWLPLCTNVHNKIEIGRG